MRVILKSDLASLGKAGDVVDVRAGYGRNFLIPRGLATPASEESMAALAHQQRIIEAERKKQLGEWNALAEKLNDAAVTFRREAGENEKLFGSVTNRDVVEALEGEGFEVDRRWLQMDEPLRSIGLFNIEVRLHPEVSATIKVFVIRA
jgi:large subunit ribosomal protein L9